MEASHIQTHLDYDGLSSSRSHFIEVYDDTKTHICKINLIDKIIIFEKAFITKGMMIPTIRMLLERGFSSNGISIDADDNTNGRSVFDIYPTRSAPEVMSSYVFKDSHGNMLIWPQRKHKERFDALVHNSFCVEVITENTEKPMVLVTDLSNKELHNRWIMTIDAWNVINPNKEVVYEEKEKV